MKIHMGPGIFFSLETLSSFQRTGLQAAGKQLCLTEGLWDPTWKEKIVNNVFNNSSFPIWGKSALREI